MIDISVIFSENIGAYDAYIREFMGKYGALVYLAIFIILFVETGLVIAPYLPGDSLLFLLGAMAANGYLNVYIIIISLIVAVILGDSTNYWIGRRLGTKLFEKEVLFLRVKHLGHIKSYFDKYGNLTIVIARFTPFLRTGAPFMAGVGAVEYNKFLPLSIIGSIIWITSFVLAGFFLGGIKFISDHFSLFMLAIIILTLVPVITTFLSFRKSQPDNK